MVFALGFLLAGLAALAFAPLFWARAVRLSVRRLEMQLPLSMREILADRDQVRAESALEQRRIEIKSEALNEARSHDLAELGRRATRITQMQEHIANLRQTNTTLNLDLGRLNRAHAELSAEASALTKELYDLDGLRNREKETFRSLMREHNDLLALADEQRLSLASLSACSAALEVRLVDTERALNTTKTSLCNKEAEATLLASHLERARDDLQISDQAHQSAVERYEREKNRSAELDGRLKEMQAAHDELFTQHRAANAKLSARETDVLEAAEREKALILKHESLLERMRSNERGMADRIDRLRSENAALQGALGAARQECDSLSRDLSALRGAPAKVVENAAASEPSRDEAPLKAHSV